ncbi:MAG: hypothetical protein U9R44_06670 [Candidatus Omnitrophota bacterium]|nr:hypothetical protein [Candidatus Omnitrophota bacterium]
MLNEKEKREIVEDAKSEIRREHFRIAKRSRKESTSLDEYLSFLQDIQKIFKPFTISNHLTLTRLNKL